jgi:hypothetical protein
MINAIACRDCGLPPFDCRCWAAGFTCPCVSWQTERDEVPPGRAVLVRGHRIPAPRRPEALANHVGSLLGTVSADPACVVCNGTGTPGGTR